jgi:hypothetical protein
MQSKYANDRFPLYLVLTLGLMAVSNEPLEQNVKSGAFTDHNRIYH